MKFKWYISSILSTLGFLIISVLLSRVLLSGAGGDFRSPAAGLGPIFAASIIAFVISLVSSTFLAKEKKPLSFLLTLVLIPIASVGAFYVLIILSNR